VLVLLLPNFTLSSPGPYFSKAQLAFVSIVSVVLYLVYVQVQTVRHRHYFLPEGHAGDEAAVAEPPPPRAVATSAVFLPIALLAVVLLAKQLGPVVEAAVLHAGAPQAVVGIVIAAVVLMPEGLAALRAAHANRLQTSLNLALGSALATIALTVPAVAAVSLLMDLPLVLGLDPKSTVLLALSLFVAQISLGTGRTTVLHGAVHLVIFAVYLFVALVP
jgi:Ca2+:H+ antiporter